MHLLKKTNIRTKEYRMHCASSSKEEWLQIDVMGQADFAFSLTVDYFSISILGAVF
jgi:hypothetical protein